VSIRAIYLLPLCLTFLFSVDSTLPLCPPITTTCHFYFPTAVLHFGLVMLYDVCCSLNGSYFPSEIETRCRIQRKRRQPHAAAATLPTFVPLHTISNWYDRLDNSCYRKSYTCPNNRSCVPPSRGDERASEARWRLKPCAKYCDIFKNWLRFIALSFWESEHHFYYLCSVLQFDLSHVWWWSHIQSSPLLPNLPLNTVEYNGRVAKSTRCSCSSCPKYSMLLDNFCKVCQYL